jgi:hypothetical protein
MVDRPDVTPGLPGSARVEYYACRMDVEAMLAKGYSARMAYEAMKEQGRVTCGYSAFCDYVRGGGTRKHSKGRKKPSPLPAAKNWPQQGPRIIKADQEAFPDPRKMNLEDAL